jgi:L,D-transpeptidase YcbB
LRSSILIAVLYVLVGALSLAGISPVRAEASSGDSGLLPWERSAPSAAKAGPTPKPEVKSAEGSAAEEASVEPAAVPQAPPSADPVDKPETEETVSAPDVTPAKKEAAPASGPPAPPHPVVAIIREKLSESSVTSGATDEDVAALKAFYRARSEPPLWVTEMGFSAKGEAALFEIAKADDWGLEAKDFALPKAGALPPDEKAQALAEIELDLAILKYARFARGGREVPSDISELFDQSPPLREPESVITEIGATSTPDAYLRSLHPQHEQFGRLRDALLEARKAEKPNETDIRRLVINMERWRWMPEDLGTTYVWLNTPEFMLYVLKDGKTVFEDKTLVGTIGNATPVFSDEMETIVFNPDWVAPPSVLEDKLWPALKRKHYSILDSNKLKVSYNGKLIDPARVDWARVNIHNFTFSQNAGPKNVLGKAKFLYPNKHIVYMHDTLPYRKKVFKDDDRAIGYGCVRMEKPLPFAEVLLSEDQKMTKSEVKELWDKSVNKSVTLESKPPVHTTYFTTVVDDKGKVSTFKDLYGLDRMQAEALFGSTDGFPKPPPEPKQRSQGVASSGSSSRTNGFASALGFGD